MAVSFDLFGTLVAADRPDDPAAAIAVELDRRNVPVPDDWGTAYREPHLDAPSGAELPLPSHVTAALRSRSIDPDEGVVRRAVSAAFPPTAKRRPGARVLLDRADERGPIGICSNCSVPGLARRSLHSAAIDVTRFDAIVTSVGCGWRKPDRRAFEAIAKRLGVPLAELVHVGDDPRTDGGIDAFGGRAVLVADRPLDEVPTVELAGGSR